MCLAASRAVCTVEHLQDACYAVCVGAACQPLVQLCETCWDTCSAVNVCTLLPPLLLPLSLLLLLLLSQEDEVPSDFQDYSLVTLVGVAAHLMHVSTSLFSLCTA